MVGWVGGEMEIKANLSLSLVEVEAELGNCELHHSHERFASFRNQVPNNKFQVSNLG